MSTVWVTNKDAEKIIGGWDGKKYEFLPRKPVEVPVALAQHFFGYGLTDKSDALIRLGWIKTTNDLPGAMSKLNLFEITETRPQGYRDTSPTVDRTPLPVPRQGEGKGTRAA